MSHSHHHDKDKEKEKRESTVDVPVMGSISTGTSTPSSAAQRSEDAAATGSLAEQVQQLLGEKQELMNTMVRRQADFENYRKRQEKERAQDRERAVESLIDRLLPVLDAFERALSGQADSPSAEYLKGFELIRGQLGRAGETGPCSH